MSAFDELVDGMVAGRSWPAMGDTEAVRALMGRVYDERYHGQKHFKDRYQPRVNLQKKDDSASYAGWITSENPTSGPYQGTSFVWFPGPTGSVAVLVIGTDGFGADTHILGRPGHARRLRALKRLHGGGLWVKPNLLDLGAHVPEVVASSWPDISAAVRAYGHVIYAAVAVNDNGVAELVSDLLDLFFDEHGTPLTGNAKARWERRRALPALGSEKRSDRVRARLRFELLPLLRDYVAERLCGGATEAVSGLADRVEARLLERA